MDLDHEVLTKCQRLYARIAELEKEVDMHSERAKDAKKRIEAFHSEIRNVVVNPAQLSLVGSEVEIEVKATT